MNAATEERHLARLPLSFIAPGSTVLLAELGPEIDATQREQLTAYGLAPQRPLTVIQHRPMTVILADEVELALEQGIARHIWVIPNDTLSPGGG